MLLYLYTLTPVSLEPLEKVIAKGGSISGLQIEFTVKFRYKDHSKLRPPSLLTLTMPNFLNGIIHLPLFGTVHYRLRDIKMKTLSWPANSIEPGQTARMCRLVWLYTGGKG